MRQHAPRFPEKFVLGFAFTPHIPKRVAMILKSRPSWQAGKLNGIGGHREPKEDAVDAMEREFFEETGVRIPASLWEVRGYMCQVKKWHCTVYAVTHPDVIRLKSMTDEKVSLQLVDSVMESKVAHPIMHNIPALLALCMMPQDHTGVVPTFSLTYP